MATSTTRLGRDPASLRSRDDKPHCGPLTRETISGMTSRRDFLRTTSGAAAIIAAPSLLLRSRATADIIVRNGTVFDGLGSSGKELDVVITGGAHHVRRSDGSKDRGTIEIDARGLAVAPGFIDIHSHGDGSLWSDPRAESLVRQGITTIVVGQDGSSRAPRANGDGKEDDSRRQFTTFAQLWTALDRLQPVGERRVDGRTRDGSRRRRRRRQIGRRRRRAGAHGADRSRARSPTARAARRRDSSTRRARSRRSTSSSRCASRSRPTASVRDAHAQRGRPAHRSDRRSRSPSRAAPAVRYRSLISRRRARATGTSSTPRSRASRRRAPPAATPRSIAIRTSRIRRD